MLENATSTMPSGTSLQPTVTGSGLITGLDGPSAGYASSSSASSAGSNG